MGLIVNVFRAADRQDCTRNGISSRAAQLCLVNVEGPSNPDSRAPAAMLTAGPMGTARVVPAIWDDKAKEFKPAPGWYMMGGNYAGCSDSRFSRAVADILEHDFYGAVAIHDRIE